MRGGLCERVAFPEYRHDVIGVEWDAPAHGLDDDGGKRFR